MEKREKDNFEKVIEKYAEEKQLYKTLEEDIKQKNNFIKKKLEELATDVYETSKYKAYMQYSNRISMNEEKVIEIIKENISAAKRQGVIKTKEYVDFDILESLIYNGIIAAEKLEPAQVVKTVGSLYVKELKTKKEKEDE